MKYNIGDSVWVIVPSVRILLHCYITGIEYEDSFYWLDEPFGHALHEDVLFVTKEEALVSIADQPSVYEEWRQNSIDFIKDTFVRNGSEYPGFPVSYKKVFQEDWFHIS